MSSGAGAQIAMLAVLTVLVMLLLLGVITVTAIDTGGEEWGTVLYHELLEVMDSGAAGGFTDGSWIFTAVQIALTVYGIFVVGALIGILATALDQRLQNLRKGRSRVIESRHVVVLGWSDQIFTLLRELAQALSSERRAAIVVMAAHDKVEMEDAIREKVMHPRSVRMVCRTGNPLDIDDLTLVSLPDCRAVVILTPDGENDPDSLVIKSLMAIMSSAGADMPQYRVFAQINDEQNTEVAMLAGRGRVELVPPQSLTARIMAETASQPGLAAVFSDLLDYEGDEMYVVTVPGLAGVTFGDVLSRFDKSVPMGLVSGQGEVALNPPMDTVLATTDQIIAVSEDDSTVVADGSPAVDEAQVRMSDAPVHAPTRSLILGENAQLDVIAEELERRAPEGSVLVIASPSDGSAAARLSTELTRQAISHRAVSTNSRRDLESLDLGSFDRVLILADPELEAEQADARTLTTLLHVRDLASRDGRDVGVVSEMLVPNNRALAQASTDYDFIVSTELISQYIAQVVMTPVLSEIFRSLLTGDRGVIVMESASLYCAIGEPVNFYTVTESARRRGQIALGYRRRVNAAVPPVVTLNPAKSSSVTYGKDDQIIVLTKGPLHQA